MDIDEFLEEKEQKSAQEILEKDRPFFEEMMAELIQKKQRMQRRKKIMVRCVGICTGVAAAFVCVFVPVYSVMNPKGDQFPVYNGVTGRKNVTIGEWTEGSNEFKFSLEEQDQIESCLLTYDINTGDTLYYSLKYSALNESELVKLDVKLYSNPYYREDEFSVITSGTVELDGLTLIYNESTYVEGDIIYSYDTVGKIEQGDEMIYFKYSETSLNSQSGFIEFVQGFVQKK